MHCFPSNKAEFLKNEVETTVSVFPLNEWKYNFLSSLLPGEYGVKAKDVIPYMVVNDLPAIYIKISFAC